MLCINHVYPIVKKRRECSAELGQVNDRRRLRRTDSDEEKARRQRHFRQAIDYCCRPKPEIRDDEVVQKVGMSNEQAGALRVDRQFTHQSLVRLNVHAPNA